MRILILGSKGQIGDHLNIFLKNKKHQVYGLDILNSSSEDLRKDNNKKLIFLIKKVDFVFFLAFDVGGSLYLKNYQDSYNFKMNNILIMKNVFVQLFKTKKKFIFASSQMSNMNYSSYGTLKKIGENLTESIGGITVRFWNIFGIERDLKKTHVITDFILKGIKSNKVLMRTNGMEERDFMYADDCCAALELIMKKYSFFKNKKTIDLNTGKFTKIKKVASIISSLFLEQGRVVQFIPSNKKDDLQLNKKNKSNKFLLKYFKPKFSLQQGIKKVFNYYISKKNFFIKNFR
jgi:nucleoside-diphosphate-sugar epimerase